MRPCFLDEHVVMFEEKLQKRSSKIPLRLKLTLQTQTWVFVVQALLSAVVLLSGRRWHTVVASFKTTHRKRSSHWNLSRASIIEDGLPDEVLFVSLTHMLIRVVLVQTKVLLNFLIGVVMLHHSQVIIKFWKMFQLSKQELHMMLLKVKLIFLFYVNLSTWVITWKFSFMSKSNQI